MASDELNSEDFPLESLYERLRDPLGRGTYGTVYKYVMVHLIYNYLFHVVYLIIYISTYSLFTFYGIVG